MKTNKLPKSAWSDSQESGSQSQQTSQPNSYYLDGNNGPETSCASNDSSYNQSDKNSNDLAKNISSNNSYFGYKSATKNLKQVRDSNMVDIANTENDDSGNINSGNVSSESFDISNGYKKPQKLNEKEPLLADFLENELEDSNLNTLNNQSELNSDSSTITPSYTEIPERIFMNGLIKHTAIALAIIIPLAAFSAYAATPEINTAAKADMAAPATIDKTMTETISIKPSAIIHKSATSPTTVDSVDLKKYAGTWYEIGRLPMYFQRNCAGDVTANYTEKTDGSGIIVTNKCVDNKGSSIVAEGLAKPADGTGSKLKVTFLPSWIRWLPVGRADYWVLARDNDYKTALVGTPDKDYLWLLARSPNVSQETYAKYRQIAQQQGYDLKEFKLTPQTNQTVSLVP